MGFRLSSGPLTSESVFGAFPLRLHPYLRARLGDQPDDKFSSAFSAEAPATAHGSFRKCTVYHRGLTPTPGTVSGEGRGRQGSLALARG